MIEEPKSGPGESQEERLGRKLRRLRETMLAELRKLGVTEDEIQRMLSRKHPPASHTQAPRIPAQPDPAPQADRRYLWLAVNRVNLGQQ